MKFDTPPPRTQPALCYFSLLPLPFKYQVLDLQYEDTIGALAELEALGHPWQVPLFHCVDIFLSDTDQCLFRKTPPKNISCHFLEWINWKCFRVNWMHWHVRIVEILVRKGHLICDYVAENKLYGLWFRQDLFFYVVSCLLAFPPRKFYNQPPPT